MTHPTAEDYLAILVDCIRVCAKYKPKGLTGNAPADESFYGFCKDVVGYDLAGFFQRNSPTLKKEVEIVLTKLLMPS